MSRTHVHAPVSVHVARATPHQKEILHNNYTHQHGLPLGEHCGCAEYVTLTNVYRPHAPLKAYYKEQNRSNRKRARRILHSLTTERDVMDAADSDLYCVTDLGFPAF